jgi:hypothetical protein
MAISGKRLVKKKYSMNKLISLVSAFKHFQGNYDRIQKSAMYSWKANDLQVVVSNSEVDTKGSCIEYQNIVVVEGVRRGRDLGYATQSPIIKDLIEKALPAVETPMVVLLNSDFILQENFSKKVEMLLNKYGYDIFVTGSRNNIQLNYLVDSAVTYEKVQKEVRNIFDPSGSDVFMTSKFLWRKIIADMPDFILGRYVWDNWLNLYAHRNNLKRFNCTKSLPVLHPVHGNEHIYHQEKAHGKNAPSCQHNLRLWTPTAEMYGAVSPKLWPEIEV